MQEVIDGKTYGLPFSAAALKRASRVAYLLPSYDEYLVAYKDRRAVLDPTNSKETVRNNALFNSTIVIDGRVVGSWSRTLTKSTVIITPSPFAAFSKADRKAVADAAHRYGAFIGLTAVLA